MTTTLPQEINGFEIPDQDVVTHGMGRGNLAAKMDILIVTASPERVVAVMPVEGNEQPFGLLHGGAYCVLGESLGSMAANLHAGSGRYAVGIDINATHTSAATSAWVTATCTPVHLGNSICVHEIAIEDARGRRCSTVRITNMIRTRP